MFIIIVYSLTASARPLRVTIDFADCQNMKSFLFVSLGFTLVVVGGGMEGAFTDSAHPVGQLGIRTSWENNNPK